MKKSPNTHIQMDYFEGTEKLLEIWFTKSNGKCTLDNDLRNISRECLDYILDLVNCKILSSTRSRDLDSYVLSESSLFVSKNRLLIKTCGTTTLLHSVRPFIEAAYKFCGFDHIQVSSLSKTLHQSFISLIVQFKLSKNVSFNAAVISITNTRKKVHHNLTICSL